MESSLPKVNSVAPTVRTNAEVARWMATQTAFALVCVLPTTALVTFFVADGDFSRTITWGVALRFSLAIALVETLIFTPLVAIRSVATLKQLNLARDELDRLANTDALTGLPNRRGFDHLAARLVESSALLGRPLAALMCDLDRFKAINDEYGHEFGDAALRHVAEILREAVGGERAALARTGGEEFVVLLADCSLDEAERLAESIRANFAARPVEWRGASASITMSVGVAARDSGAGRIDDLISRADRALYKAKRAGRNCIATLTGIAPNLASDLAA